MNYEDTTDFSRMIKLTSSLLEERGKSYVSTLLNEAFIRIISKEDNIWFGGGITYTIQMDVPIKLYSSYTTEQINGIESIISNSINEVTKVDDNVSFITRITPSLDTNSNNQEFLNEDSVIKELRQNIDIVKSIMVSVATGGERIQNVDDRYKKLHSTIKAECDKLGIPYNNKYASLWDWYGKWRVDFPSYQERRDFIRELFASTLTGLDNSKNNEVDVFVQLDDLGKINRMIGKIRSNTWTAKDIEDFQSIGVSCREVLISLGQIVYNPALHGEEDETGTKISKADAERMFLAYFKYKFSGKHNKELRDYVKGVKGIANQLTHKDTSTRKDMLLTVSTTLSLINFIGILEDKI